MKKFLLIVFLFLFGVTNAQIKHSGAAILQDIKKLSVHGSVLYIAAHPDDENTRLLSYLANERLFRTGYLSLTRGDGGQNLIGDDQGVDLGLIRTQELLAARRVDGAEQFFTSAYDFGFCKSPEEALSKWDHQKILSEVVHIIRKFKPDVIITRFPTTGEGGHGHHTASAVIAGEAFEAAGDPEMFPGDLPPWQAKRLLWNTFNFGGNNTTKEDQLKIDAGGYNALLGMSYGEMAAESRSKHKSQGFGVPAQRGSSIEYFSTIKGPKPEKDLMDGIDFSSSKYSFPTDRDRSKYNELINSIVKDYDPSQPQGSIVLLQQLESLVQTLGTGHPLYVQKNSIQQIILNAAGLFYEVISQGPLVTVGDSGRFNIFVNNRAGLNIESAAVLVMGKWISIDSLSPNINYTKTISQLIPIEFGTSQPYWLEEPLKGGSYIIKNKSQTGIPESYKTVTFRFSINGKFCETDKPIYYKYTDPVKGEQYQYAAFVNPVHIQPSPALVVFTDNNRSSKQLSILINANRDINQRASLNLINGTHRMVYDSLLTMKAGTNKMVSISLKPEDFTKNSVTDYHPELSVQGFPVQRKGLKKIAYDHIPTVYYENEPSVRVLKTDIKTEGSIAGYIPGAGDKIPEALQQLGYKVVVLGENDITAEKIKDLDVIVTGIRAYNIHPWLSNSYPVLMNYIFEGGKLLIQYNTNNSISNVKSELAPYPFTISRNRITDETAAVNFLIPEHKVLNYPNKITTADFDGWIQERSIYNAENADGHFEKIISMNDPGEPAQDGSLIIARYGKGRVIYTGLVFFRELPAGVPGAYRLFANLLANKK